ncbi:MAG: nicotinate phosphoribosyltransferase [Anaerolineales bacterium]
MKDKQKRLAEGILYTDEYQLTMAQLYFRFGLHERHAQFDHFFRSYPDYGLHQAGYCIIAGLDWLLDWIEQARFGPDELQYLRGQTGSQGTPIFQPDFLDWLEEQDPFSQLTISAIPEGRVVHPNVPLTIVRGPLAMAQILETSLLNHINYQTLIATKACRISQSGRGRLMLEFGMRRAQEKGALAGARGALIGGADFSSNVGISHVLGYPPKGTHAHSMVQAFMALGEGELGAFQAYADVYPDDCLLLVDTINTLESGIPNAIKVFEQLHRQGHEPVGIRLDSGDLAHLSIEARKMLDQAGFEKAAIVLSNQLDELVIWQILTQIEQEAPRSGVEADAVINSLVYGVGTNLITSLGQPALDGVYKLVAIEDEHGWRPAIKISETPAKTVNPGHKRVWRIYDQSGKATADLLTLFEEDPAAASELCLRHPTDHTRFRTLSRQEISKVEPLHEEIFSGGRRQEPSGSIIESARERRKKDLSCLYPGVTRLMNPHIYHVSLSEELWQLKQDLIKSALGEPQTEI